MGWASFGFKTLTEEEKVAMYVYVLFTANLSAVKPRLELSNFRIVKNVYVLVFVYSFEINM